MVARFSQVLYQYLVVRLQVYTKPFLKETQNPYQVQTHGGRPPYPLYDTVVKVKFLIT